MKHFFSLRRSLLDSRGATLVFVALLLVVLLGVAALVVDIGYAAVVRNELQNAADAAALAGARQLGANYEPLSMADQQAYVCDRATVTAPVIAVAGQNLAANAPISVLGADIVIGKWDATTRGPIVEDLNQPDAVQVTVRRDSEINGPVSTFFARVLGINTYDAGATATAALTGTMKVDPGELIPVGLSKDWFDSTPTFCGQPIKFNPSNAASGCAGWNTFTRWPANTAYLRDTILEGWLSGSFTPPGAEWPVDFVFYGNTPGATLLTAFENLFNYMKTRDRDDDPDTWSVYVPVYDNGTGCSNPTGTLPIVGFAAAKITSISGPPDHLINAVVVCDLVEPTSRGGGNDYGVKGSIPGLVK